MHPPAMADQVDLKALNQRVTESLVRSTRTANKLVSQDIEFQKSIHDVASDDLDTQSERFLSLARTVLSSTLTEKSARAPAISNPEDVDTHWDHIVDCLDSILEKADICLDEFTGVIKRGDLVEVKETETRKGRGKKKKPGFWDLDKRFRTQNIPKPQRLFKPPPNNYDTSVFRPLLTYKPHSTVSLEDSLLTFSDLKGNVQYQHPYKDEIENYVAPDFVRQANTPIKPSDWASKSAIWVNSPGDLSKLLDALTEAPEIAIDLEHHDARSYLGIVSLMQISTRDQDWLIDTLVPWRRELQILNRVFADPTKVKVLHGAQMDIIWLQRDLGLYIVGLFDTFHACQRLGLPEASLASLLETYTDFTPDKKFALADWRIRPLHPEMMAYARADTHFLLNIYDFLRNELIERSTATEDALTDVFNLSKETALQRFERNIYRPETGIGASGWFHWVSRYPAMWSKPAFAIMRAVHNWRENLAREEDESPSYLVTKAQITNLSKEAPQDRASLEKLLRPMVPAVEKRLHELLDIIAAAVKTSESDLTAIEFVKKIESEEELKRSTQTISHLDGEHGRTQLTSTKTFPSPKPTTENSTGRAELSTTTADVEMTDEPSPKRIKYSTFWGSALGSSNWSMSNAPLATSTDNIRLAIPLPPLTAEIFKDNSKESGELTSSGLDSSDMEKEAERMPFENSKVVQDEFECELNSVDFPDDRRWKKWKDRSDSKSDNEAGAELRKLRSARKKARKNRKRLEAEAKAKAAQKAQPFDYESAEPILHSKQNQAGANGKGGRPKPAQKTENFNPYQKPLDGPAGLGRKKKPNSGLSKTFKN